MKAREPQAGGKNKQKTGDNWDPALFYYRKMDVKFTGSLDVLSLNPRYYLGFHITKRDSGWVHPDSTTEQGNRIAVILHYIPIGMI